MSLQYGDFTWPNDPERLEVTWRRSAKESAAEDGRWSLEAGNRCARIFEGEGDFYGPGAYSYIRQLAAFLDSGDDKILVHPQWGSVRAILADLTAAEAEGANLLHYTFRMIESPDAVT